MSKGSPTKIRVRRPTEERALGAIARESARLGITQADLFSRSFRRNMSQDKPITCFCIYCKRRRNRDLTFRVILNKGS